MELMIGGMAMFLEKHGPGTRLPVVKRTFQECSMSGGKPFPVPLGLLVMLLSLGPAKHAFSSGTVEAITFALTPGELYLPAAEIAGLLHWKFRRDEKSGRVFFNDRPIPPSAVRKLLDGADLVSIGDLGSAGAALFRESDGRRLRISSNGNECTVFPGEKRVEVNLANQKLRAWQGQRLVLESRISSGRGGSTPAGEFRAGPYKARMHYSSRYANAPMPWSVQINGHIFIHGFRHVPDYPASHGCIRLPLTEGNPAKFFYEWIDQGTPVRVLKT